MSQASDTTSSPVQEHPFLTQNQEEFAGLLTFLDFSQGFNICFVEVNFPADAEVLMQALKERTSDKNYKFEVFNFSRQPDLRFLRDELVQRLKPLPETADQPSPKRIVIVQGLEASIGTDGIGEYPPVLQDLNFVRDAYRTTVPYPVLFILPDYALTRLAKYAPDFWAWRSAIFQFKAHATARETLHTEVFEAPQPFIASPDNQALIERLNQLLMEYHPSGQEISKENLAVCADINFKLGDAYLAQQEFSKAINYFQEARKLAQTRQDRFLEQGIEERLGQTYLRDRKFEQAKSAYLSAQKLAEELKEPQRIATAVFGLGNVALERRCLEEAQMYYEECLRITLQQRYVQASIYHQLGYVAQKRRELQRAKDYYQKALDIEIDFADDFSQAKTYHQLGMVSQDLREFQQAIEYYQKALKLKERFGDHYSQAYTYHQLGIIAEELCSFAQSRNYYQKALDIFIEFGDRFSQAKTYNQIGTVSRKQKNYDEAIENLQKALEIRIEFGDRYSEASTYHNLGVVEHSMGNHDLAMHYYHKALAIRIELGDLSEQAQTYQQLGVVEHQKKEFQKSKDYYQKALEIKKEFNDRYSQAKTYCLLGYLEEELREYEQAKGLYLQALEIFKEFNDEHNLDIVLQSLRRLYNLTQDESLLSAAANILNLAVSELKQRFSAIDTPATIETG